VSPSGPPSRLDEALDRLPREGGTVRVDRRGAEAEVTVVEADRLGVRVRGVSITRERPIDVSEEAKNLPERLRSLPERVAPVEVDAGLGGARLRTPPDELRGGREYFEVDVAPSRTSIRRTRVSDGGEREETDWTMTREQLDRLIDETTG
jgi:hypothetical protein